MKALSKCHLFKWLSFCSSKHQNAFSSLFRVLPEITPQKIVKMLAALRRLADIFMKLSINLKHKKLFRRYKRFYLTTFRQNYFSCIFVLLTGFSQFKRYSYQHWWTNHRTFILKKYITSHAVNKLKPVMQCLCKNSVYTCLHNNISIEPYHSYLKKGAQN